MCSLLGDFDFIPHMLCINRIKMTVVWHSFRLCNLPNCHFDVTRFEYLLWHHIMHEWIMNLHDEISIAPARLITWSAPLQNNGQCVMTIAVHTLMDSFPASIWYTTLFLRICWFKCTKMYYIPLTNSLPKLMGLQGWFPFLEFGTIRTHIYARRWRIIWSFVFLRQML